MRLQMDWCLHSILQEEGPVLKAAKENFKDQMMQETLFESSHIVYENMLIKIM